MRYLVMVTNTHKCFEIATRYVRENKDKDMNKYAKNGYLKLFLVANIDAFNPWRAGTELSRFN